MEPGGTLCRAETGSLLSCPHLPGFTSWPLGRLLCWKITPGLLQGKAQHPGAVLDPRLGLVPAEGAHEEHSGSPSREPQERHPYSALPEPEEATK